MMRDDISLKKNLIVEVNGAYRRCRLIGSAECTTVGDCDRVGDMRVNWLSRDELLLTFIQ